MFGINWGKLGKAFGNGAKGFAGTYAGKPRYTMNDFTKVLAEENKRRKGEWREPSEKEFADKIFATTEMYLDLGYKQEEAMDKACRDWRVKSPGKYKLMVHERMQEEKSE